MDFVFPPPPPSTDTVHYPPVPKCCKITRQVKRVAINWHITENDEMSIVSLKVGLNATLLSDDHKSNKIFIFECVWCEGKCISCFQNKLSSLCPRPRSRSHANILSNISIVLKVLWGASIACYNHTTTFVSFVEKTKIWLRKYLLLSHTQNDRPSPMVFLHCWFDVHCNHDFEWRWDKIQIEINGMVAVLPADRVDPSDIKLQSRS